MSFGSFLDALDDNPFEETPVGVREFVEGKRYLHHPPLSDIQYDAVEASSQIYREKDLQRFMGVEEGSKHYKKYTKREVILQLGKGCHASDTPVYNPNSGKWEPISSLGEGSGLTLSDLEAKIDYATESFKIGYGDLYRITFANGLTEDVSPDHSFLTTYGMRTVKQLQEDRYPVITPIGFSHESDVGISDQEKYLLAIVLTKYVEFPDDDNEQLTLVMPKRSVSTKEQLHMAEMFDIPLQRVRMYRGAQLQRSGQLFFKDDWIIDKLKEWGMYNVHPNDRPIPEVLWKLSTSEFFDVMHVLWWLDGSYEPKANRIRFRTRSQAVGEAVHKLLIKHGVMVNLRHLPNGRIKDKYLPSDSSALEEQWELFSRNGRMVRKFTQLMHHESDIADQREPWTDDYVTLTIQDIEYLGEGEHWTRSIPSTGMYFGNTAVSKNSGKDLLSTIAVSYIVYKLLCLKDPAVYYGKPSGDAIDIINIAINAQQAKNVFFKGLKNKITKSPWFIGKYTDTIESIQFDKSVTAYSGHSERESHEGLNLFAAVLDEISGFGEGSALNEGGKNADNIYNAFRGTVDSRFPEYGKVVLLSFPRHDNDFITRRYNEVVATKDVVMREHEYIINPENDINDPNNKFTINWEEDHITGYLYPGVFAVRRPTWDVNPTLNIEDFKIPFYTNPTDALQRFACQPQPTSDNAFFRDKEKLDRAMSIVNPVNRRDINSAWKPDYNKKYFVHADLAQKYDKCAVAVAHVEKWVTYEVSSTFKQVVPLVVVDMFAYWEPRREGPVNLAEVKNWILSLRHRHLPIARVTFDRWNSFDMIRDMNNVGIQAEVQSVGKKEYDDFAMMLYEERVVIPRDDVLREELLNLKVINNKKVDHLHKYSKDISDAVVGAAYGAMTHTPREGGAVIEVYDMPKKQSDPIPEKIAPSFRVL